MRSTTLPCTANVIIFAARQTSSLMKISHDRCRNGGLNKIFDRFISSEDNYFRENEAILYRWISLFLRESDDVHCKLFYASTTGFDGDFLRWIASWKFRLHIQTFHIIRSGKFRRRIAFQLQQSQRSSVGKLQWCKRRCVNVVATAQPRSPTIDRELMQKRRRDVRIAESKESMLNRRFRLLNRRNWR